MKQISIYSTEDYRQFLKKTIESYGKRGFQGKLAKAASCHPAYFSQVINGSNQFTPDHALGIAKFLFQNDSEIEYFLNLIYLERSATPALKDYYKKKLRQIKKEALQINKLVDNKNDLSEQDKITYYSDWKYSAVHILLTIPKYRNLDSLIDKTHWPLEKVKKVLDFLVQSGLAKKKANEYLPTKTRIHLPSDSALIKQHHSNLRMKAIELSGENKDEQFQYSSTLSVSVDDYYKIKAILHKSLEEIRKIIKETDDEEIYCLNIDLLNAF